MKYKNIRSAIHNYGDSFMGGINYFEGDHVMYDVHNMVEQSEEKEVTFDFSNGTMSHPHLAGSRVSKSLQHYKERLADHLVSHDIEPKAVKNITLTVRQTLTGNKAIMSAIDDRGHSYQIEVKA